MLSVPAGHIGVAGGKSQRRENALYNFAAFFCWKGAADIQEHQQERLAGTLCPLTLQADGAVEVFFRQNAVFPGFRPGNRILRNYRTHGLLWFRDSHTHSPQSSIERGMPNRLCPEN